MYVLFSTLAVAYNGMNYGPNGAGGKYQNNRIPNKVRGYI